MGSYHMGTGFTVLRGHWVIVYIGAGHAWVQEDDLSPVPTGNLVFQHILGYFHNGRVYMALVKFLGETLLELFLFVVIAGAAYTYYKSLSQEESLQRRGKLKNRKIIRRRRERIVRVGAEVECLVEGEG